MEKFGLIDLNGLKPRDYRGLFLKNNPFPTIGIPGDRITFCVDREKIKSRFKDVLSELIFNENSSITVIVGDYGTGKSHLLKLFKQSVNEELLPQDNPVLSIYIKSPGEDIRDLYLQFIDGIDSDLLVKYSKKIVENYMYKNKAKVAKLIHDSKQKENFLKGSSSLDDVLQKSLRLILFQEIRKEVFKDINSEDLIYAFLAFSLPELSSKSWKWFQGEKLDKIDKEILMINSQIDDDETAFLIIKEMFKLLRIIGIKSLVLLIDEFEKLTFIHPTKRTKYQDKLRALIDANPKNLCLYFAIAPTQWKSLAQESTAFIRRLGGNWDELEGFTNEDTKTLIQTYLYFSRVEGISVNTIKEKYQECDVSLCPFTIESIIKIQEITKGRVNQVILVCRKVLDYYCDHQTEYSSITPELVNKVWQTEA